MEKTIKPKGRYRIAVVRNALRQAIGSGKAKDDEHILVSYATDYRRTFYAKPGLVVLPESREDVQEILKAANKHKIPVTVQARGNHSQFSIPCEGGIVLDCRRMNRIIEINTDSGYAVVETGVTFDDLTAALKEKGFRCHVPTAPGGATPVGNYLLKPAGSLATRHLDCIQDVEVVIPDGTVFTTGSAAFPGVGSHLRYAPFPDLAGLITMAYGTMGVVTKAALKIYPVNECSRVALVEIDNFPSAVDFVKDITNHNIPEHSIIWFHQLHRLFGCDVNKPLPPELHEDPKKAPPGVAYSLVCVMLSGYTETVDAHLKVLQKVAQRYGGRLLSDEEAKGKMPVTKAGFDELYTNYHQVEPNFFGLGASPMWITMSAPKDVKELEKWALDKVYQLGVTPVLYYCQPFDYGRSMMFRIFFFPDPRDKAKLSEISRTFGSMFEEAMKRYRAIPMRHSPLGSQFNKTGGYAEVLTRIKKAIDPNNILNRNMKIFAEDLS
ncbi:MAG: FAD-binding oxidoreductase [Desulfobacteraceae bacterium]|nr:MAG: FAD-binding oxidoreductase [Desulfobacteraceae bacterium]